MRRFLPEWVINHITRLKPPQPGSNDRLCWRPATDGCFSVKAAYHLLKQTGGRNANPLWRQIWKWHLPEKVKYFVWQITHDRLMTNSTRKKRGIAPSEECPLGCGCEETTLHTLRDCQRAQQTWRALICPSKQAAFFSGNLHEWLRWNARESAGNAKFAHWPWTMVFGMSCWLIWKYRCKQVFQEGTAKHTEILHQCTFHLQELIDNAKHRQRIALTGQPSLHSGPEDPGTGAHLEVDASTLEHQRAACGGWIRSNDEQWLTGFKRKLGVYPCSIAELLAIKSGLEVCQMLRITKVQVYSDSIEAINMLWRDCSLHHPYREEIMATREIIQAFESVHITHKHRELLRYADFLAKEAHHTGMDLELLRDRPTNSVAFVEPTDSRLGSRGNVPSVTHH